MGKKGNWFTAIKKVFSSSSKEKQPPTGSEKKNAKEKKKNRGMLKHGENKSFIPIFREPSSIEKILGEVDQQKLFVRPSGAVSSELPLGLTSPRVTSPRLPSPRAVASPRALSPKVASPRASSQRIASPRVAVAAAPPPPPRVPSPRAASPSITQNRREVNYVFRPEPTLRNQNLSATKIQAAYRGYMARRSFRALKGLVRLQGVLRSQNVKRQTVNAMKQMQLLVRVQNQIQSRRIQMLENQALQRQSHRNDKDVESTLSKWTLNQMSEAGTEDWDDSLLTKDEVEVRLRRKVEAVIKRERAMAYAYSHQLWKSNPKSALDFRSNGFPWWWNWLERQLPSAANPSENQSAAAAAAAATSTTAKSVQLTPPRAVSDHKPSPSPRLQAINNYYRNMDNHESTTPKSSKSTIAVRSSKQFHNSTPLRTPTRTPTPQNNIIINNNNNTFSSSSGLMKYSRGRASSTAAAHSAFNSTPMNDETDSLTSCPPFSVPNYMAPTVSAKAKVRASSNPKERIVPGTPPSGGDSKRRFSFPLTPNIASFKWNKGSNKDNNNNNNHSSSSHKVLEKHESMRSIGEISVDSAVSMPAIVGRKPFNRFV